MSQALTVIPIRGARPEDVRGIHALVAAGVLRGHLLPRSQAEIRSHLHRWVVARQGRQVVGCLSLEPTEPSLWEVRSVCVAPEFRSHGLGHRLVETALCRGRAAGIGRLFAVTVAHGLFRAAGFSPLAPAAPEWSFVLRPIRPCYRVVMAELEAVTSPAAKVPLVAPPSRATHGERAMGQTARHWRAQHGLVALAN